MIKMEARMKIIETREEYNSLVDKEERARLERDLTRKSDLIRELNTALGTSFRLPIAGFRHSLASIRSALADVNRILLIREKGIVAGATVAYGNGEAVVLEITEDSRLRIKVGDTPTRFISPVNPLLGSTKPPELG
jgi:hypothetical protein